jgi:hypothetical protein
MLEQQGLFCECERKGSYRDGKEVFATILSISNIIFAVGLPSILRTGLSGSIETSIVNLHAIITKRQ